MSARTVLNGEAELRSAVGTELGITEWFDVTEQRLAEFTEATGDQHAHYFAVSLSNMFLPQIVEVHGFALGINYGTEAVRIGRTPQIGDRLRGAATLDDVSDVKGGVQSRMLITIELEGGEPACTIESLSRWMR